MHDLRHTFATRLRRSGVSNEVRKDLLAHANSDITTHYSAGELKELLEAVERLVEQRQSRTQGTGLSGKSPTIPLHR